jgi:hypothetical protein
MAGKLQEYDSLGFSYLEILKLDCHHHLMSPSNGIYEIILLMKANGKYLTHIEIPKK